MAKAKPGDPLKISANDWNNIQDATRDYLQRRQLGEAGGAGDLSISSTRIKIKNSSGAARSRGHVLEVSSLLYTTYRREHPWFDGVSPTPSGYKQYAILLRDAPTNAIVEAQVVGRCLALVNITDANHKAATISASTYVLQSALVGPISILYQPSGTGEKTCDAVLPSRYLTTRYRGQLQGALATSDTTKTVDNLVAIDGLGGETSVVAHNLAAWSGADNNHCWVEWCAGASRWEMYQVKC